MGHDHSHHHGHDRHDHGHSHAPADFGRAFAIGIALNTVFVIAEATFGFLSNSVALLADAGHNLSDVFGLVIAWIANVLARRPPSARLTYGWRGSSILAAMANALMLLVAVGAIAWEAVHRLINPQPVASLTMVAVAALGIVINGATAWLFAAGREGDLNVRGAFIHMAADALVSLGVVIAGLAIWATGALWFDPLVSLIVAAVVFWSTWGLLRESTAMSMAAVPTHVDMGALRRFLEDLPGVANVHDLHVWPMSTTETALTCHLVTPGGHPGDAFLHETAEKLEHDFRIHHVTIQVETENNGVCARFPDDVV